MLTAKDTEYDKVVGLDGGADDYVSKPFGMMELISRIKAVRRRTKGEGKAEKVLSAGVLEVNCTKHIVLVNHQEVTLTLKEFELLCFLLENKSESRYAPIPRPPQNRSPVKPIIFISSISLT